MLFMIEVLPTRLAPMKTSIVLELDERRWEKLDLSITSKRKLGSSHQGLSSVRVVFSARSLSIMGWYHKYPAVTMAE